MFAMQFINLLKGLSNRTEFFLILFIGFGLPVFFSNFSLLIVKTSEFNQNPSWLYKLTNQSMYFIVLFELVALFIILYILRIRGLGLNDFNLTFSFRLVLVAVLLLLTSKVFSILIYKLIDISNVTNEVSTAHIQYELEAKWISITLVIIINSFYEEFLLIGYLFRRLEKYHPALVIGISLLLRESYHTYQGWISLIGIVSMGLVFGYYYFKYKKMWPVILAHSFNNLFAFLSMHFHKYPN